MPFLKSQLTGRDDAARPSSCLTTKAML